MESGDVHSTICDVPPGSDSYGCWQHPFRDTQIRMHPAPLRLLSDKALRCIKAKPESEIGGILWGKILDRAVVVEDAQLIESSGPLYNTLPSDARNLEEAIKRSHPDGLKPVGYFRSHVRDGLCLSAEDQNLISKYLRSPEFVFLLIRPFEMGICVGAFFFWQNGRLQTDGSDLEVPFLALDHHPHTGENADQLQKIALTSASEQSQDRAALPGNVNVVADAQLLREPHAPEQSQSAAPLLPPAKRFSFPLVAFTCFAVIAAASGTATYFAFPALRTRLLERIGPVAINPEVGLKVARAADGQLDLTWNRSVMERVRAQQGLLTITDGPVSKQLTIDSVQLHSGALTYFPSGSDIQFRLEITLNAGHSIAESVRVILPRADLAEAPVASPTQPVIPKHTPGASSPPRTSASLDSTHPLMPARTPFKAPAYIPPREILRSQRSRQQPRAPDLKVDLAATTYAALPSLSFSALPVPPAHVTVPVPSAASARNLTSAKPPVAKSVPGPSSLVHTVTAYVPARPLRQVMPDLKMAGPGLAAQAGKVEIQVSIDEAGHVKDVRPVPNAGKTTGLILNAAIAAARQWTFQPATLHGKPVAAEHRIVFDFQSQENR